MRTHNFGLKSKSAILSCNMVEVIAVDNFMSIKSWSMNCQRNFFEIQSLVTFSRNVISALNLIFDVLAERKYG